MISLIYLFESASEYSIKKDNKINNKFMIHKHYARKAGLHYDLRIGYEGVLKSFACRKIKELIDEEVKKISVFQQPDHGASWFDFEGEITDGYGAGKVQLWDKGRFKIIQWKPRVITLAFAGEKLKGEFSFILYKPPSQWLMFRSTIAKFD